VTSSVAFFFGAGLDLTFLAINKNIIRQASIALDIFY
jgi:hypothetical protein